MMTDNNSFTGHGNSVSRFHYCSPGCAARIGSGAAMNAEALAGCILHGCMSRS